MSQAEGWTWLHNSRAWHYFRDGRSLCGKWLTFQTIGLDASEKGHDLNCKTCLKKLASSAEGSDKP